MIELSRAAAKNLQTIESDKIVFVKVIERSGNKARIEINGISMEAEVETETPSHFLALIEKNTGPAGDSVRLRLLGSFKRSSEFAEFQQKQTVESIRTFFMQNGIAMTEGQIKLAVRFLQSGLKLDKEWLRLANMANLRFGDSAAEILLFMAHNGIAPAEEFIDFFFGLRALLRENLKRLKEAKERGAVPAKEEVRSANELIGWLKGLYGGSYEAKLIDWNGRNVLVQSRKEERGDAKRYYFDVSDAILGGMLIVADEREGRLTTSVFLNEALYRSVENRLCERIEDFNRALSVKTNGLSAGVRFAVLADRNVFYLPEAQEGEKQNLGNVDISI